jgi:hypothetical protein
MNCKKGGKEVNGMVISKEDLPKPLHVCPECKNPINPLPPKRIIDLFFSCPYCRSVLKQPIWLWEITSTGKWDTLRTCVGDKAKLILRVLLDAIPVFV